MIVFKELFVTYLSWSFHYVMQMFFGILMMITSNSSLWCTFDPNVTNQALQLTRFKHVCFHKFEPSIIKKSNWTNCHYVSMTNSKYNIIQCHSGRHVYTVNIMYYAICIICIELPSERGKHGSKDLISPYFSFI